MSAWVEEIITQTLEEEEKKEKREGERRERRVEKREKREGEGMLVEVRIKNLENNAVFLHMFVNSKSRPGLVHKVRVIGQNGELRALACDCEGWQYHHKCWHTSLALQWARKHGFLA